MRLVNAGIMAVRDPKTGEIVQSVPLYVDADYAPAPISEDVRKQMIRDICRDFRAAVRAAQKNKPADAATPAD